MFVANPKKPPQIEIILRRNKAKLLAFLRAFHNDKEGGFCAHRFTLPYIDNLWAVDEQFSDEKQFLITQIEGL